MGYKIHYPIKEKRKTALKIFRGGADDTMCPICLEDFDETKHIVYLDCQHIYHEDCIIEWINKDPSCPLCRTNSLV